MQGFMILDIIGSEKDTLVNGVLLDVKFQQSQWSVKCRSWVPGHGAG